ncbi:26S proteasome non-ATPase regulatory subunit 3 [Populus alba x Populus x berolinensis]|nr:26S proteasome non-ATPase regulatory subunit 3 [Populus alba x Populus x berolinensis]
MKNRFEPEKKRMVYIKHDKASVRGLGRKRRNEAVDEGSFLCRVKHLSSFIFQEKNCWSASNHINWIHGQNRYLGNRLRKASFRLETTRHVAVITINLSNKELNTSSAGLRHSQSYEYEVDGTPLAVAGDEVAEEGQGVEVSAEMSTEAHIISTSSTPAPSNSITSPMESSLKSLTEIASLIETGSCKKEVFHIARAVRLTNSLKKKLAEPNLLQAFLDFALSPGSELHNLLSGISSSSGNFKTLKLSPRLPLFEWANLSRGAAETAGVLARRVYFYYSYIHVVIDDLDEIRWDLLYLLTISTLHHDDLGQAEKLRSKALRFQSHTVQQLMAFEFCCSKWAVLVHLLLGEIPERTIFKQSGLERALRPYFMLTNAVRIGDLELFRNVAEDLAGFFGSDKTYNLIVRLRHNVIRTGLRKISISYSRISLADVAEKLKLDSATLLQMSRASQRRPSVMVQSTLF